MFPATDASSSARVRSTIRSRSATNSWSTGLPAARNASSARSDVARRIRSMLTCCISTAIRRSTALRRGRNERMPADAYKHEPAEEGTVARATRDSRRRAGARVPEARRRCRLGGRGLPGSRGSRRGRPRPARPPSECRARAGGAASESVPRSRCAPSEPQVRGARRSSRRSGCTRSVAPLESTPAALPTCALIIGITAPAFLVDPEAPEVPGRGDLRGFREELPPHRSASLSLSHYRRSSGR